MVQCSILAMAPVVSSQSLAPRLGPGTKALHWLEKGVAAVAACGMGGPGVKNEFFLLFRRETPMEEWVIFKKSSAS